MKRQPSENERGLECAIVKMALSAQQVELSPDDLPTMRRLTKTLQSYLRVTDIALGKKNTCRKSNAPDSSGAATAA